MGGVPSAPAGPCILEGARARVRQAGATTVTDSGFSNAFGLKRKQDLFPALLVPVTYEYYCSHHQSVDRVGKVVMTG